MKNGSTIERIVFSDEITLWWRKETFEGADGYRLYLDGVYCGATDKTHYTFAGLAADGSYDIRLEALAGDSVLATVSDTIATPAAKRRLDVTAPPYSAVGDGVTLNTAALQRALDDCTAGDCVYFPKGTYLTGALDIHSDTEVYLAEGATLQGSPRATDYLPKIESRFEGTHMECYRSLINMGVLNKDGGYSCENVVLRGKGSIFGGGRPLGLDILETERAALREYLEANRDYVKTCENEDTIPGRARGRLINMSNCRNVIIGGLDLGYAASWNVHFTYCRDIVTYGCRILSHHMYGEEGEVVREAVWNGDGWNPDSSERCAVFATEFNTYDNSIAIKSGKNPEGNVIGRPSRDILVFDCRGNDIAVGSEMSGGIDGVTVWDSTFVGGYGVNIKATRDRGAYIRNIHVRDCTLSCIMLRTRIACNNDGEAAGHLTSISDLLFENVALTGEYVDFSGREKQVAPIYLDAFDEEEAAIRNVTVRGARILPGKLGEPKPNYFHNVKNLVIED